MKTNTEFRKINKSYQLDDVNILTVNILVLFMLENVYRNGNWKLDHLIFLVRKIY